MTICDKVFCLFDPVPKTLKEVVNPLSGRRRRMRRESSKPGGVVKTNFKVRTRKKVMEFQIYRIAI